MIVAVFISQHRLGFASVIKNPNDGGFTQENYFSLMLCVQPG